MNHPIDCQWCAMHREFVRELAEALGIPPGFPSWYVPPRPALPAGPLGRAYRQLVESLAHPVIRSAISQSVLDDEPRVGGADLRAGTLVVDGAPLPPPVRELTIEQFIEARLAEETPDQRQTAIYAALRKIVEEHAADITCSCCRDCQTCGQMAPCATVRAVAEIWCTHPDYRREWTP